MDYEIWESQNKNASTVEEIEWNKLKITHFKDGYSDGKCVGSEMAKGSGEEHGYVKGFEDTFNYELSIAMGLLGVNQCILRKIKSPLLSRAKEIKSSLDNFRRNYNTVKMKNLHLSSDGKQQKNDHDENSNVPLTSIEKRSSLHVINGSNDVTEDLHQLKSEILDFLNECNQPLILNKMTCIFENLNHLMQPNACLLETFSEEEILKSS
ncbi:uncharacterized protein TNCT_63311 [Trichonephila clavata]|uniref:Essential protein Yae1 N-terminal domain-containing protein n=1 Tax=Trichonephila clavata TaxID=2740835 RepID=A0A8X6HIF6_TRICU|nr:uncharacterized protein TNCT_63311 [Trichonephila clavata]